MRILPILFSTEMVQAILDGRKTMTRRIVKQNRRLCEDINKTDLKALLSSPGLCGFYCPYGEQGNVLWVRETFFDTDPYKDAAIFRIPDQRYYYRADDAYIGCHKWKSSRFMPREAARLFLIIKDVRVERLQDISKKDAIKEGVRKCNSKINSEIGYLNPNRTDNLKFEKAAFAFENLWENINGKDSWDANPWVWVISFERIGKPEGF